MNPKLNELIAIGASVTANCVPCVKFHVAKAQHAGASNEEISTAVNIGRMVRTGAAEQWDKQVEPVLPAGEITE